MSETLISIDPLLNEVEIESGKCGVFHRCKCNKKKFNFDIINKALFMQNEKAEKQSF